MKDKNDFWNIAYGGIFSSKHKVSNYSSGFSDGGNKLYSRDNCWFSFKWIVISILILFILVVGICIYHHHKYKCVEWHKHWQRRTGRFESGYHWVYHCDKKILRTEYNKNPEKYHDINHGCDCEY